LNFGATGNMDKGGFEPLAMGVPLVTTNEAFKPLLAPYGLYVPAGNPEELADAIVKAQSLDMRPLVAEVQERHSLQSLIPRVVAILS
jgi:glycosyltransferase involved in cell wall biosynthesis